MHRDQRLRSRKDFAAVYRKGRPGNGEIVAVRALRNDLEHSRFGFAVSRRVG